MHRDLKNGKPETETSLDPIIPDSSTNIPSAPYIVSPQKIVILSISTLGLYYAYWFYRQFSSFKKEKNWQISPLPRAIFWVFTAHSLLLKVAESVKEYNPTKKINTQGIAVGIIGIFLLNAVMVGLLQAFSMVIVLVNPLLLLLPLIFGFLYVIPLVYIQNHINNYWHQKLGNLAKETKFLLRDYLAIAIGGFIIVYFSITMYSMFSVIKQIAAITKTGNLPYGQDIQSSPTPSVIIPSKPVLGVDYRMTYDMSWQDDDRPLGAYITRVKPDTAALKAGIQAGDIIMEIDGQVLDALHELKPVIEEKKFGATISLKISRNDTIIYLSALLN